VNDAPTAVIDVSSPSMLETNGTNYVILAPDSDAAAVILDGSRSTDVEHDSLQYFWFEQGTTAPFAAGIRVTNEFDVGTHAVVLGVSDGTDVGRTTVVIDVVPISTAVELLVMTLEEATIDRGNKRPFIVSLKAAAASFDTGRIVPGRNQLVAFQNKVRAQLGPQDPQLADALIKMAQQIIDALAVR
jgi:hypothetical protein